MNGHIIKFSFVVLFCITLFGASTVSAETKELTPISSKTIIEKLPHEDEIVERALNGENLDTKYTKVNVIENAIEDTKTVEIDKVLSESIYKNGEIETENEKTFVIMSSTGKQDETTYHGTYSASVRVVINYDRKTIKNTPTIKMKNFQVIPKRLDSQFKLTKLSYEARSWGTGYLSNGKPTTKLETTKIQQISNPTNGKSYNKPITSWTKYVESVNGLTGVTGKLTFKRTANGKTYSFNFSTRP